MQAITPTANPHRVPADAFYRAKTPAMSDMASQQRPVSMLSESTEIFDTDFEDESEYEGSSPKNSWESDSRRRSQTTISSYDEAPTPSPRTSSGRNQFDLGMQPVEGPKGPHLFRSSQVSAELGWESSLRMSPVLPKDPPPRTATAYSDDTVTPVTQQQLNRGFSIDDALWQPEPDLRDPEAQIRSWSTQQVIDWMYETGIDSSVIECFDIHDINGAVLLDLQFEDLKELDIASFGKRHQLWSAICLLRGEDVDHPSPQQTPFQDISRPCTTNTRRSPSRSRRGVDDSDQRPTTPSAGKKRRGRKPSKASDIITPAESVSIVAIEQLLPKPHKCAKGERCAKWRKQQRELEQLQEDHGIGRFPISPTKGGHIFVAGNPGNATTANNMVPNVYKQPAAQFDDSFRPMSEAQPSVVASSDLLGPGQLPDFALHEDMLVQLGSRDPQDNVKQFLDFQHVRSTPDVGDDTPPTPPFEMFPSNSVLPFPASCPSASPFQSPRHTPGAHEQLKSLPRLEIPRSASAEPHTAYYTPGTACRSATASPAVSTIYRMDTPASEMDVPLTAIPLGPVARDNSQSVPPNMQFRNQKHIPARSHSRADWRRPSMALPAVKEGEVFSPSNNASRSSSGRPSISTTHSAESGIPRSSTATVRDPAHHSPQTKHFTGYGPDCTQSGWMKKRKTKILRHEWQDAHFRLKGTQLSQHANARLSSAALDTIDVDNYAVLCSSIASGNKLSAAMKALNIKSSSSSDTANKKDATAFAFQLVPERAGEEKKKAVTNGKTHHFAVASKDERIDWMREVMLAKALQQKAKGYEVEVNGQQA